MPLSLLLSVFLSPSPHCGPDHPSSGNMGIFIEPLKRTCKWARLFLSLFLFHTTLSYSVCVVDCLLSFVVDGKAPSTTNNRDQLTNQLTPLCILVSPFPFFSCLPIRLLACCYLLLLPSFCPMAHFVSPTCACISRATQWMTLSRSRPRLVDSLFFFVALLDSIDPAIIDCHD